MSQPKFFGTSKNGQFIFNPGERARYDNYIRIYPDGKNLQLAVGQVSYPRTTGQPGEPTNFNGYLFGILYRIIGDEIGELDLDYIHHWIQMKVGNIKGMPDGTVIPAGTSHFNGHQFSEYCDKVRRWGTEPGNICTNGLILPLPNEEIFE